MSAIEAARAGSGEAAAELLIEVRSVAKAFGPTQALNNATLELRSGEVHALVGENGSGKSTLVKILSGVHAPDSGEILLDGRTVNLPNPRAAQRCGIATVFQEVFVAEARSVLDNVWLGFDGLATARNSAKEKRAQASALLEELLDRRIDLGTIVENLSLSDRQACGIVRALVRRPQILILDEATSALDVATRDRLFEIVGRLREEGAGVIFITHRMDEISAMGDRITVMRSGEVVGTLGRGEWTPRDLVQLMSGADQLTAHIRARTDEVSARRGEIVMTARGLQLRPGRAPFDVDICGGELIGVAGLEGHGQDEFLHALRGMVPLAGRLVRHDGGEEAVITSTKQAAAQRIAYIPRERSQSTFNWMSIRENFGLPTLGRDALGGWLRPESTRVRFKEYVARLGIVLGSDRDRISTLSGGNQQKVVIARWLAAGPRVLILNDPTRGVDIGTKRELYTLLTQLAGEGLAVVMLSTELDEHVELMDRVLVFREHELFVEIDHLKLTRQSLAAAFFGQSEASDGVT